MKKADAINNSKGIFRYSSRFYFPSCWFETSSSPTQIAITELHKGDFVDIHVHPTMDEHYYFMEGEGFMMIVDEKYICKAGTYLLIPAGYRHSLQACSVIKFMTIGVAL